MAFRFDITECHVPFLHELVTYLCVRYFTWFINLFGLKIAKILMTDSEGQEKNDLLSKEQNLIIPVSVSLVGLKFVRRPCYYG